MDKHAERFILAGLCYLLIAFAAGVGILAYVWNQGEMPPAPFVQAYRHVLVVGWLSSFGFGLGLHLLPRISGRPLHSVLLANIQFWTLNLGILMRTISQPFAATYGIQVSYNGPAPWLVIFVVSSGLELIAAFLFSYNVARTVLPKGKRERL